MSRGASNEVEARVREDMNLGGSVYLTPGILTRVSAALKRAPVWVVGYMVHEDTNHGEILEIMRKFGGTDGVIQ